MAQLADHRQPAGKAAAGAAVSRQNYGEPILTAWARSFIFAGSSAVLLLVANLFPGYWYFSFFALTPFLYRIIKATPAESLRLGFLFGLCFFGASAAGSSGVSSLVAILKLLSGVALFALFGWTAGWARQRWGFNPSIIALLWVGLEIGLVKVGFAGGLFGKTGFSHPLLHSLVGLFGFLATAAIIVLLNSLLVLAITKAVRAARIRVNTAVEDVRAWDLLFVFNLSNEKFHLVPQGRAPPLTPKAVCATARA